MPRSISNRYDGGFRWNTVASTCTFRRADVVSATIKVTAFPLFRYVLVEMKYRAMIPRLAIRSL
jgi:hypothetical protein